jgi:hypothetical protein
MNRENLDATPDEVAVVADSGRESLNAARDRWPCGCAKGFTPHGVGWSDCIFTDEGRARMETPAAAVVDARQRETEVDDA